MIVEIKEASEPGQSLVEFDNKYSFLMPEELAESIKAHCEFQHGLVCDGKLTAVFRDDKDRDTAKDLFEEIYDCVWGETC